MKMISHRMTGTIIGRRAALALAGLGLAAGYWIVLQSAGHRAAPPSMRAVSTAAPALIHASFLHGRITTVDGATYQGRLRFGGDEEAFWGDYFNAVKKGNPWAGLAPEGALRKVDLDRPIMARFGDIAKIEANGRHLWVTLKSGHRYHLARYAADDFADGVRIWDERGQVVTLNERRVRSIEFFPVNAAEAAAPVRLHGTVRTRAGDFTGFIQWNRREGLGLDALNGRSTTGKFVSVPFQTIRSIARQSDNNSRVTLLDGGEFTLSDTREVGTGNSGMYVDDARYGRVLVSWDAFIRVDFNREGGSGPAYTEFPAGEPLAGTVTTRAGQSLTGRLVFDLDESQITETLDAPFGGVDYTIPFGMIASIKLPASREAVTHHVNVKLQTGVELQLVRAGDLGAGHAGMLIFVDGRQHPEYVSWAEVQQVDFVRPTPAATFSFACPTNASRTKESFYHPRASSFVCAVP
jgi:hypothetical protein